MADTDVEKDKKRKISALSSTSELDTSSYSPSVDVSKKKKKSKGNKEGKKKKKAASAEDGNTQHQMSDGKMASSGEGASPKSPTTTIPDINRQLSEINKKLSNVITKGDDTIREMIKDIFQQMKEEFLKSVSHRIDILEGKLFEKDKENESLRKKIAELETDIENRKSEIVEQKLEKENLVKQMEKNAEIADSKINDLEQYGRRNNLKINGLPESEGDETAEMTADILIEKLNGVIGGLNLKPDDIDIAHRLGKKKRPKPNETVYPRRVIVKFHSRCKRDAILRNRKLFKGTDIYVNEDLTKINQLVLSCVRKKMSDEVEKAWSKNGRIMYENKTGEIVEVVYSEFQEWIDLPWPAASNP